MTDAENIVNALNGVDMGSGDYTCKKCKRKFQSPVEVKHHMPKCSGRPGFRRYRTTRQRKE
jgi:hypothetical protein